MQNITFYARAAETLGEFTDYANAKTKPAPILTRGVAVCLQMRLFKEDGSLDPVPIDTFADVKAWQWVMDDDFDSTSNYILVAQHDQITVEAKTEEIEGESRGITEFTIPIPEMNTEELDAVLQKKENVANLNGELVGLNGAGEAVYILQLKGFTVRNRISSTGNPTPITAEYYTAEQTRAIIAGTNAYELARKAEFHIGDRAYYPGEPGYLLVCVHDGTSAADLPELDKTVNVFLDGTVTWQVYDLSASGGGAANITVNGISPDPEGNILLGAENISFNLKDSMDDDIPTSPAISNMNLQEFFTTLQYAIFSVNGHCAYIDPSAPTAVQGDISIYGNTMYLTEDDALPESDWDGNPLNEKTVYDLAVDVYSQRWLTGITVNGEVLAPEGGVINFVLTTDDCKISINLYNALKYLSFPSGWRPEVSYGMAVDDLIVQLCSHFDEKAHENSKLVPAGTVIAYAGWAPPDGYLVCAGGEVSRTTYANLFAAIDTTYGAGDGETTFNLPDLTDRVVQGSAIAGTALTAGLPDISAMFVPIPIKNSSSGNVGSPIISYSGALTMAQESDRDLNGFPITSALYESALFRYSFNASSSNSIYGNSSTVQPPALTMIYCIKY